MPHRHRNQEFELCRFSSKSKWLYELHRCYLKFIISILSKKGGVFPNSNAKNITPTAYILHDDTYFKLKDKRDNLLIMIKGVDVLLSISQNQLAIGDIDFQNPKMLTDVVSRLKLITVLSACRFLSVGGTAHSCLISVLRGMKYYTSPSYKLIFLNLSSVIPFEAFSFLNCDIDVF